MRSEFQLGFSEAADEVKVESIKNLPIDDRLGFAKMNLPYQHRPVNQSEGKTQLMHNCVARRHQAK